MDYFSKADVRDLVTVLNVNGFYGNIAGVPV